MEYSVMSAADALSQARAAGIRLSIDGEDLLLEAASPPPTEVLNLLAQHKNSILTLLCPGSDGWAGEDWQEYFDERAGISEFESGLSRSEAEAHALALCAAEWLRRQPNKKPFEAIAALHFLVLISD
jgi:hypothetical protein